MEKKIYLLSLTISGIKNIEKVIKLDFYRKTITKDFDPTCYRVKAIYGENGAGKTGIVMAVKVLQSLLLEEGYLNESVNQEKLDAVINKRSRKLYIECEYAESVLDVLRVFKYSVTLEKDSAERYVITHEQLQYKSGMYSSAKYKTLFECVDGEATTIVTGDKARESVLRYTANRLSEKSFLMAYLSRIKEISYREDDMMLFSGLLSLFTFGLMIVVNMEQHDTHDLFFLRNDLQDFLSEANDTTVDWDRLMFNMRRATGVNNRIVHKTKIDRYREDVRRLCRFLQLFKSDLVTIDIDEKENGDRYECSLLMNYGDYRVSLEFESNGIKKLVRLFRALDAAVDSAIVFIDEMDSNINDIYLCKIVEFFVRYGKGQLCFTTHNTSPMEILRHSKKSIDFISNDNRIIPWHTDGNFAPDNLYKNGMIQYLPFNIEAEDFLGVLGE